jgi:hypothetical protein
MSPPAPLPERLARIRRALLDGLPAVAAARLALWLLPFRVTRRYVAAIHPRKISTSSDRTMVRNLVRAIRASSRLVPKATCLTQAIALHYLLARRGHQGRIHIGVRRLDSGSFESHAWVELDGEVVIGGEDLDRFIPLLELQEESN